MPSYHRHGGFRLDLADVLDAETAAAALDVVHELADDDLHTHETLERELQLLGRTAPGLAMDLWVEVPDFSSWAIWSLRNGEVTQTDLTWEGEDTGTPGPTEESYIALPLGSDGVQAWEKQVESMGGWPESERFPRVWAHLDGLTEAAEIWKSTLEQCSLAVIELGGEYQLMRLGGGAFELERLVPTSPAGLDARFIRRLFHGERLEVGVEPVLELDQPDDANPLIGGHPRARLAALKEFSFKRDRDDLPGVMLALTHPNNAGADCIEFRRAAYRFITWFDEPAVWDQVLLGLRTEAERVREGIEHSVYRLKLLQIERAEELAAAQREDAPPQQASALPTTNAKKRGLWSRLFSKGND